MNQLTIQWKSLSRLEMIGAALTLIGSFLPWGWTDRVEGDGFLIINGIDIGSYGHHYDIENNGGMIIILLTLTVVLLAVQVLKIIRNPILWNLIISILLMTTSLCIFGRILMGYDQIRYGLIMVVVGSTFLLWMAVRKYRNSNEMKTLDNTV
jgi:hypothetical protein